MAGKCLRIKKLKFFSFSNFKFFFPHFFTRATPGPSASNIYKKCTLIRMFYFIFIDKPKNTFIELGNRKCEDFLHTSIMLYRNIVSWILQETEYPTLEYSFLDTTGY